jgi:thymidylate kinase
MKLLKKFFPKKFEEYKEVIKILSKYEYVIIKLPTKYPEEIFDFDIIMKKRHVKLAIKDLLKKGFVLFRTKKHYPHCFELKKFTDKGFVSLDIYDNFLGNVELIDAKKIIDNRIKFNCFYIPNKYYEYKIFKIKPIIRLRKYKDFEKKILHKKDSEFIKKYENKKILYHFKYAIIKNKKILTYIYSKIKWLQRVINLKRKGFCLCFIGLDGSGKSSFLNEFNKIYSDKSGIYEVDNIYFGWKPKLISTKLLSLFNPKSSKKGRENLTRINKQKLSFFRGCIMRISLINYYFEFIFRYLTEVYPKLRRTHLVLLDRYPYDVFVQNPIARKSKFFKFLFKYLFPKPDICIYLDTPMKDICKRKKEFPKKELIKQNKYYKNLAEYFKITIYENKKNLKVSVFNLNKKIWKKIIKKMCW